VRVLMIGLGGIGQRHLRNLHALLGGEMEVSAYRVRRLSQVVTDTLDIEPGADIEEKYRITVHHELDRALAARPDLALICNPSSLHVPVALEVARAGCHIFMEKPLSHDLGGVAELIDEVERRDLVGLVGYQLRFHPCLVRLKELIEQRAIGSPVGVRMEVGEYLPGWHAYEDYRRMYASRADLGGGVILSQIHELDQIYGLFGRPERLFALGGHLTRLEVDVEDVASILMQCRVAGRAIPVHLHQDYIQRPPSRQYEVIGDAGKILVDLRTTSLTCHDGDGQVRERVTLEEFPRNRLFLDEMTHLLACLRREQAPLVTLRDGAESLRMALAAKESIATGRVVELPRGGMADGSTGGDGRTPVG
jgi:predicted dehydrogenase